MALSVNRYYEKMAERTLFPLPAGLYKLNETKEHLEEWLAELRRVEVYKKSNGYAIPTMLHCTPWDIKDWINEIPNTLLEILGYDVAPSIAALKGNLVPHDIITELSQRYLPKINSLAKECTNPIHKPKHLIEETLNIIQPILGTLWLLGYDSNDK